MFFTSSLRNTRLLASEYMTGIWGSFLMCFAAVDEDIPALYLETTKQVFKRLFRLYAHIYHYHYEKLREIGEEAKLNSNFRHLVYFIIEFDLVKEPELRPLKRLIREFAPDAFSVSSKSWAFRPVDIPLGPLIDLFIYRMRRHGG